MRRCERELLVSSESEVGSWKKLSTGEVGGPSDEVGLTRGEDEREGHRMAPAKELSPTLGSVVFSELVRASSLGAVSSRKPLMSSLVS